MDLPKIPVGKFGEAGVQWITLHMAPPIHAFDVVVTGVHGALLWVFGAAPPLVWIVVVALAAWHAAGRGTALFSLLGLLAIWNQGLWVATVKTLSLVLTAAFLSLCIAVPIGIAIAESRAVRAAVAPILNFVQTMPRFVYLIPAVIILGIDVAPAIFATITLAVVPPIRMTALGIAEVDPKLVEAGTAMGCSRWQLLAKVKLPLAAPAIMLGVNQCVMMSLSMVVIASLIGASGLGDEILKAIAQLRAGEGILAGLAIFVLAITIDRITLGWAGAPQAGRSTRGW